MSIRRKARTIVEQDDTAAGKAFDWGVRALIVFSVIGFSLETIPTLSPRSRTVLLGLETLIVAVFTVEYALRVWVAERPLKYIFSLWGLIDLAAILPFYIVSGVDLRSLRVLRLLRMLKLFRYSQSVSRFGLALKDIKDDLIVFGVTALMMLYLASVGIYLFESEAQPEKFGSVFDCLWWAVCTLTTVGYGDIYPVTAGGRAFTFFVLVIGLGTVAVPSGLLASALTKRN